LAKANKTLFYKHDSNLIISIAKILPLISLDTHKIQK